MTTTKKGINEYMRVNNQGMNYSRGFNSSQYQIFICNDPIHQVKTKVTVFFVLFLRFKVFILAFFFFIKKIYISMFNVRLFHY